MCLIKTQIDKRNVLCEACVSTEEDYQIDAGPFPQRARRIGRTQDLSPLLRPPILCVLSRQLHARSGCRLERSWRQPLSL